MKSSTCFFVRIFKIFFIIFHNVLQKLCFQKFFLFLVFCCVKCETVPVSALDVLLSLQKKLLVSFPTFQASADKIQILVEATEKGLNSPSSPIGKIVQKILHCKNNYIFDFSTIWRR